MTLTVVGMKGRVVATKQTYLHIYRSAVSVNLKFFVLLCSLALIVCLQKQLDIEWMQIKQDKNCWILNEVHTYIYVYRNIAVFSTLCNGWWVIWLFKFKWMSVCMYVCMYAWIFSWKTSLHFTALCKCTHLYFFFVKILQKKVSMSLLQLFTFNFFVSVFNVTFCFCYYFRAQCSNVIYFNYLSSCCNSFMTHFICRIIYYVSHISIFFLFATLREIEVCLSNKRRQFKFSDFFLHAVNYN